MESLLDELENVLDSYLDQSFNSKNELSEADSDENKVVGNVLFDADSEENKGTVDKTDENNQFGNSYSPEYNFTDYRIFSCTECSLQTNSEAILLLHMKHNKHVSWVGERDEEAQQPFSYFEKTNQITRRFPRKKRRRFQKPSNCCNICETTFISAEELRSHFELEHPGKKIYYCSEESCDYGTNYTGNLRMHKEGFHNQNVIQCDLCPYRSKWKPTFLEHRRHVHGIYEKKSKYFLNSKAQEPTQCPQCKYIAPSQKVLVIHMRNKHREIEADIKCDECSFVTHNQIGLKHHKRWIHSGIIKITLTCKKCPFSSTSRKSMKVHKKEAHGVETARGKIHKCKFCDEEIRGEVNYKKHKVDVHGITVKIHKCWFCDFKTTSNLAWKAHKTEHPNSEYKCSQCSFSCKKKEYLVKHIVNLHNSKTFPCEQCDRVYRSLTLLKAHVKSSHDEKTYLCDECDFKGVFKCHLTKHKERCHNPDKPIVKQEKKIIVKREETKDKTGTELKCDVENCTYQTTVPRYLTSHIKRVHNKHSHPQPQQNKTKENNAMKESQEAMAMKKKFKTNKKSKIESPEKNKDRTANILKCEEKNCTFETSVRRYLSAHIKRVHNKNTELENYN